MEDIERKNLSEDSVINIIESVTLKDFFFYTLSICGLLLYVGTNLYITIIADYQLFVWHPILMTFVILFSTQGKPFNISCKISIFYIELFFFFTFRYIHS